MPLSARSGRILKPHRRVPLRFVPTFDDTFRKHPRAWHSQTLERWLTFCAAPNCPRFADDLHHYSRRQLEFLETFCYLFCCYHGDDEVVRLQCSVPFVALRSAMLFPSVVVSLAVEASSCLRWPDQHFLLFFRVLHRHYHCVFSVEISSRRSRYR